MSGMAVAETLVVWAFRWDARASRRMRAIL
jgi:hypothetical protein